MISQTAEYALRAVVALADSEGQSNTTAVLAEKTKVPSGYLAKILQNLAKSGLINSQRGLHGGFSLARSAEDLSIYDIVQAVDPIMTIDHCPLGIETHNGSLCPLHRRLASAIGYVTQQFRKASIADLLAEPNRNRPLCSVLTKAEPPSEAT